MSDWISEQHLLLNMKIFVCSLATVFRNLGAWRGLDAIANVYKNVSSHKLTLNMR